MTIIHKRSKSTCPSGIHLIRITQPYDSQSIGCGMKRKVPDSMVIWMTTTKTSPHVLSDTTEVAIFPCLDHQTHLHKNRVLFGWAIAKTQKAIASSSEKASIFEEKKVEQPLGWDLGVVSVVLHRQESSMIENERKGAEIPFLESSSGTSSVVQTLGNIIVSIVGTGVLGLPFAFRIAGWLAGSLGVAIAGLCTFYCMLLLVQCRDKLASEEESMDKRTYGDLGYKCLGNTGRYLTEFLIFIAQCGGSVAYLVFIGQNLSSIFLSRGLTYASYILILAPIEIGLSWIGSLSKLAPFSIFANICNALAMAIVVKEDLEQAVGGEFSIRKRTAITSSIGGLPFAGGMAVFCFEGFGMTLALEASMRDKASFPKLLAQAFSGITLVYVLFGFSGYMAFGDDTRDIITLNLPRNWWSIAVQIGLCVGLLFTFPIMVHPINEIMEGKLHKLQCFHKFHRSDSEIPPRLGKFATCGSRAVLVIGLAALASFVPGFGMFASLVGSTVCALISFVLPSIFHLRLMGSSLQLWERALDWCILFCGLLFAAYGTLNSVVGV